MDSPSDSFGSDRTDSQERPSTQGLVTPAGDARLRAFSNVGLGSLTAPPRVRKPASAASSRRSASDSPGSNSSLSSGPESVYSDARTHLSSSSIQSSVQRSHLSQELSCDPQRPPGTNGVENNEASVDKTGQAEQHEEEENEQDETQGSPEAQHDEILLEEGKLRIKNTTLEQELQALEYYCEIQQHELERYRQQYLGAERLAERRRQEVLEIKRLKEHSDTQLAKSQARNQVLERDNAMLRSLEDEKHKRNKAEWKLGDLYGELEHKRADVRSLLDELQELRDSKEESEKAREKSEAECEKLQEHIKRSVTWIRAAHKQQVQKDKEQFRLLDRHFVKFGRQRRSISHASVRTSGRHQEILAEYLSSARQSLTSQSLVSSIASPHQAILSGFTSPSILGASSITTHSPMNTQFSPVGPANTTPDRLSSGKKISFHLVPTPSRDRFPRSTPGSAYRRQSYPYYWKNRHNRASLGRDPSVPDRASRDYSPRLQALAEEDETIVSRTVAGRSLSVPTAQEELVEVLETLQFASPWRIIWDNSNRRPIFEPEHDIAGAVTIYGDKNPVQKALENFAGSFDNVMEETNHTKGIIPWPASFMTEPQRYASMQGVFTTVTWTQPKAGKSIPPMEAPTTGFVIPEDSTGISSAVDYPPSPGLRKRQSCILSETSSAEDLESTQDSRTSKIAESPSVPHDQASWPPLAAMSTDELSKEPRDSLSLPPTVDAEFLSPSPTAMENSEVTKKTKLKGSRAEGSVSRWKPVNAYDPFTTVCDCSIRDINQGCRPRVRRMAISRAFTIPAIMALCSWALILLITSIMPLEVPALFCKKAPTCRPCPTVYEGYNHRTAHAVSNMSAKMDTLPAWPAEVRTSAPPEPEILTEWLIKTVVQTRAVKDASSHTKAAIKTQTETLRIALSSALPPTRSLRLRIRLPGSPRNGTSCGGTQSSPLRTPQSLEVLGDDNRPWVCSCPTTLVKLCEQPEATSLPLSHSLALPRGIEPTAYEIDESAAKARQRDLELRWMYNSPTHWGLLPSIQRWVAALGNWVLELTLGETFGAINY
ncbi:hypothetical protein AYO21_00545 [Fonsecaea monophora]|uniref:Uncharacterized protein n=1 Tax=Fonsecaea monophora TaxID=254056 RepID=A0A177FLV8_9EURO|nr:hypothetical protein AYO21_00545 [Fonsecaea monophora]OAG45197.1 hypothetical protein AYO21_00545 [Fonsecaea monophora]